MRWLQILKRSESCKTEGVHVVVPTAIEDVTARACQREYILGLLTLVNRTIVCLSQVVDKKTTGLT